MADGEVFTAATGQGLVVSTGILGDLVLPAGAFDPGRADEIHELAAQAAVYATQARGPGRRSRSGAPTTPTCALPPCCAAGWNTAMPIIPTILCSLACAPAAS